MDDYRKINEKIEVLRARMYKLYAEKPNSLEVLEVSQQLDQTLNEFSVLESKTSK